MAGPRSGSPAIPGPGYTLVRSESEPNEHRRRSAGLHLAVAWAGEGRSEPLAERPSSLVNKSDLSERDICTQFITPAIVRAGWDLSTQVREEVSFTAGRVIVRGKLVTREPDQSNRWAERRR